MSMEQCKDLPVPMDIIMSGKSLILKSDKYTSVFAQENIYRLDWYILSRSNNEWRVQEKLLRKHPRKVFYIRKKVSA